MPHVCNCTRNIRPRRQCAPLSGILPTEWKHLNSRSWLSCSTLIPFKGSLSLVGSLISSCESKRTEAKAKDRLVHQLLVFLRLYSWKSYWWGVYQKSSKVGFQLARQHFKCSWLANTISSHQPQDLPRPWNRQPVTAAKQLRLLSHTWKVPHLTAIYLHLHNKT